MGHMTARSTIASRTGAVSMDDAGRPVEATMLRTARTLMDGVAFVCPFHRRRSYRSHVAPTRGNGGSFRGSRLGLMDYPAPSR